MQQDICKCLMIRNNYTVSYVPDRPNIFLEVKERAPSTGSEGASEKSLDNIFVPLLEDLRMTKQDFPKTVIYTSLPYCAHGHDLASRILQKESGPVAQYHAPQTQAMKKHLVKHFREADCETRLFATKAYSMGTGVPDIRRTIHIGPASNLESYIQVLGRAGRDGNQSVATIYVNKHYLGKNREHIDDSVRNYCQIESCRRVFLMQHFGFQVMSNEPKHLCCDKCKCECACQECILIENNHINPDSTPEPLTQRARLICRSMLQFYFQKENALVTMHPIPETVTGLTEELISTLITNFSKYVNKRDIYMDFPYLSTSYLVNINRILSTVDSIKVKQIDDVQYY